MSSQVNSDEAQPADLATAIMLLSKSLLSPKKSTMWIKVCEPDVFDRSDTRKLQPFLVQCTLNFCNCPDAFTSDSDKVTFTLSYLKGTVLDWFEPLLTSSESLPWLNNYSDFVGELKNNFGPHDPEGEAKADLENLKMWNRLAAHVQWGDAALHQQMYYGLLSCIKDEITHIGKPNTLHELHSLTQSIDFRYWEHHSEVAWENLTTNKNERSNNKGKGNEKTNTPQNADKNKNNNSGKSNSSNSSNTNAGSSNTCQKKPNPDLSSKLRKDGKLTQAERQHHFKQNLCLFCGKMGHIAKECSKVTSSTAKAHSASSTDKSSDAKSGTESKNPWAVLNTPHQLRTALNSPLHPWSHN